MKSGKLSDADADGVRARLAFSTELAAAGAAAGHVIECVIEDLDVKADVLGRLDAVCRDEVIFASNTSQFSISALGAHVAAGPGDRLALVQPAADDGPDRDRPRRGDVGRDLAATLELAERYGKQTIVSQGHAGVHHLAPDRRAGTRIGADRRGGIASAEDVNLACVKAFNHAMGPLDTIDFSGLDTTLRVADNMRSSYGERFLAPQNLRALVSAGHLGRKTGRGFRDYGDVMSIREAMSGDREGGADDDSAVVAMISWDGAVATVTVDNPPVNALDDATLAALRDAAGEVREARAVVLTGAGEKAFLAGADLHALRHALGTPGAMEEHVALTRPTFEAWRALEMPLIAAVAGHAVGGGLEFALLCDLICAGPKVRFGLPEVTLGLMPGGGGTQRLPRRIGSGLALELMLTGKLVHADEAPGLVNVSPTTRARRRRNSPRGSPRCPPWPCGRSSAPAVRGLAGRRSRRRARAVPPVCATEDARAGADAFLTSAG